MTNSHIAAHVARYIAIVVAKLLQTCSYKAQIQCNYTRTYVRIYKSADASS